MNKSCLPMVKQNKIKNNKMCGPWFFPQMKYDTWIGFELHHDKPNANVDSFLPLSSRNNLVSFYHDNTTQKEN